MVQNTSPPVMLSFLARPVDPMMPITMCSEMLCASKLFQSAGQWKPSNALQLGLYAGKHLAERSTGFFQCVSQDENCVAPPAGGHQVEVYFAGKNMRMVVKQKDVSCWRKIGNLCWSRFFGSMFNKVEHQDRGTVL